MERDEEIERKPDPLVGGVMSMLAAKDAEIAKLRAEVLGHEKGIVALGGVIDGLRSALAAARAALDGERELHDETQRALNLGIEFAFDAADGRPGIETACEVIAKFDQRRAAEAKGETK